MLLLFEVKYLIINSALIYLFQSSDPQVDCLINCAAVKSPPERKTADGHEFHIGVNYLVGLNYLYLVGPYYFYLVGIDFLVVMKNLVDKGLWY